MSTRHFLFLMASWATLGLLMIGSHTHALGQRVEWEWMNRTAIPLRLAYDQMPHPSGDLVVAHSDGGGRGVFIDPNRPDQAGFLRFTSQGDTIRHIRMRRHFRYHSAAFAPEHT